MAKTPEWTVRETGEGGGPLVVQPTGLDAPGRALAGIGHAIGQIGQFITAEAREAEAKTKDLQVRTEAAGFVQKKALAYNSLVSELGSISDPAVQDQRHREFMASIEEGLSGLSEEAQGYAKLQLAQHVPAWDANIRTGIQMERGRQSDTLLKSLDQDAVATRNTAYYEDYLMQRLATGMETNQTAALKRDDIERRVTEELAIDEVAKTGNAIAQEKGTAAAIEYLNSGKPFYGTGVNPQRKQQVLDQQVGLLTRFQAQAAQEARQAEAAALHNGIELYVAAAQGNPVDLKDAGEKAGKGLLDPLYFRLATEMVKAGPAKQDDLTVLAASYDWLRKIREDTTLREQGLAYVMKNAPGNLKGETAASLVREIQTAGSLEDAGGRLGLKVAQSLLDDHYDLGTFGDKKTPEAQKQYLAVKQELSRWGKDNPKATEEQITGEYQALLDRIVKPSFWQRVRNYLWNTGGTTEWGAMQALGERQAATLEVPGDEWTGGYGTFGTYQVMDPSVEPLTVEEFYDTYKSLPQGSPERADYYGKWAKKWQ